ncbi:MAG: CoA transferase, partial [Actinobacteria bacterium]|nr:CoA transferase [Actinomycetota bacterium]
TPDGVEIVLGLAERSDVVVQNFRPGVVERLGIDFDTVAARNPDVIYGSVSGFGPAFSGKEGRRDRLGDRVGGGLVGDQGADKVGKATISSPTRTSATRASSPATATRPPRRRPQSWPASLR